MTDLLLLSARQRAETALSQCLLRETDQTDELQKALQDFFHSRLSSAHILAVEIAKSMRFDAERIQQVKKSIQKLTELESFDVDVTVPDPGASRQNEFVVVTTSSGSELFNPSDPKTPIFGTKNVKALRSAICQWDGGALPAELEPRQNSPVWASCIMELLHLEVRLAPDLHARNEVPEDYARKCLRCIRRLFKKYEMLPPSFVLKDVVRDESEVVDSGGFANIYIARHRGQKVCLKRFRTFSTSSDVEKRRLIKDAFREALVWKSLQHPNVLPFLGVSLNAFKLDPTFCLISPWLERGNLMHHLRGHPDHDRWTAIREIAQALNYLHDHGIIHGDIKGANVLVSDDDHSMLSDFGLASVAESVSTTVGSRSVGSVRWLAPEFLLPDRMANPNDLRPTRERDIYAYACTVLEIFTGELPFSHCRLDGAVIAELLHNRRPLRSDAVPPRLWNLISTCWSDVPNLRPSASQVLERVQSDAITLQVALPPSPVSESAGSGPPSPTVSQPDASTSSHPSNSSRPKPSTVRNRKSRISIGSMTKDLARFGFR